MQDALLGGTGAAHVSNQSGHSVEQLRQGKARIRLADRSQVGMHICSIDELVPVDHQVRMIWDAVCQMDLSAFIEPIRAREFTEGRPANDVRVMVSLWLWAAVNNVAGADEADEAKRIYLQRAATARMSSPKSSDTINADARTNRGMAPFSMRGIAKVTCVALWSALAYTVLTFPSALT